MKHKTKNRVIKKKKGRKTKKNKMRHGGALFTSMSFGIPGLGSVSSCPDEQTLNPKYGWLTQKCYMINGNKILKTQYPNSGAASGAADGAADGATDGATDGSSSGTVTPAKPWYQFWPDSGSTTKPWYQIW